MYNNIHRTSINEIHNSMWDDVDTWTTTTSGHVATFLFFPLFHLVHSGQNHLPLGMGPQCTFLLTQTPFLPWSLNQPTDRCIIIIVYRVIWYNYSWKRRCTEQFTRATREFMRLQQSDSAIAEWICWPWVNTVSTSTWTGSKHKRQATTTVKVRYTETLHVKKMTDLVAVT